MLSPTGGSGKSCSQNQNMVATRGRSTVEGRQMSVNRQGSDTQVVTVLAGRVTHWQTGSQAKAPTEDQAGHKQSLSVCQAGRQAVRTNADKWLPLSYMQVRTM